MIPDQVESVLLTEPGRPVALDVGWVDLLDDPDSRVRNATHEWIERLRREISLVCSGQR